MSPCSGSQEHGVRLSHPPLPLQPWLLGMWSVTLIRPAGTWGEPGGHPPPAPGNVGCALVSLTQGEPLCSPFQVSGARDLGVPPTAVTIKIIIDINSQLGMLKPVPPPFHRTPNPPALPAPPRGPRRSLCPPCPPGTDVPLERQAQSGPASPHPATASAFPRHMLMTWKSQRAPPPRDVNAREVGGGRAETAGGGGGTGGAGGEMVIYANERLWGTKRVVRGTNTETRASKWGWGYQNNTGVSNRALGSPAQGRGLPHY